ncbi:MAG: hypothetical protein RLZZ283_201 [Candidatus Parcubacteria bacterium]|jgi:hypothetical protein
MASSGSMHSQFPDPNLAANRVPHDDGARTRDRVIHLEDDQLDDHDGVDFTARTGRAEDGRLPVPLDRLFKS